MSNSTPYELRTILVDKLLNMTKDERFAIECDIYAIEKIVYALDRIISGQKIEDINPRQSQSKKAIEFEIFVKQYNNKSEPELQLQRWMTDIVLGLMTQTKNTLTSYQFPRQSGVSSFLRVLKAYLEHKGYSVMLISDRKTSPEQLKTEMRGSTIDFLLLDNIRLYNKKLYETIMEDGLPAIKQRILTIDTVE